MFKNILTCLLFVFTFILVSYSEVNASTIVFTENFESTPSAWITFNSSQTSGGWKIFNDPILGVNKVYGTDITGTFKKSWASAGDVNWSNYEVEYDILAVQGEDKNFGFRVSNDNNFTMYGVHLRGPGNNDISLEKFQSNIGANLLTASFPFSNNTWYRVKIVANGANFIVYVNNVEVINYLDNGSVLGPPILNGKIAMVVTTGATAPTRVRYDNIVVRDLDILPVPFFFQDDPTWANDGYGNVADLTMASDGCWVTSAAMILNYFEIDSIEDTTAPGLLDLTPQTLNNWLKLQPDGYLHGGNANAWAILRWVRTRHDLGEREATVSASPLLSYEHANVVATSQSEIIDADLLSEQPNMLRVSYDLANGGSTAHFLVAKGKKNNIYQINDPLNVDTDLDNATYDNELTGYRRFTKQQPTSIVNSRLSSQLVSTVSGSDLSALILTIPEKDDILVTTDLGEKVGYDPLAQHTYTEIPDSSYIHELPIAQITNPETSPKTSGIKILTIPHLPTGSYTVSVFHYGEADSMLQVLGYDSLGEVTIDEKIISTDESYIVNFNSDTGDVSLDPVVTEYTFDDLIDSLQHYRDTHEIKPSARAIGWIVEARLAKNADERGYELLSQRALERLRTQILHATPKFVEQNASDTLLVIIDSLSMQEES